MRVIRLAKRFLLGSVPFGPHRCAICQRRIWGFLPYRYAEVSNLMNVLDMVGSDIQNFECPVCGAHDRERHLLLYLRAADLFDQFCGKTILHFAPEQRLAAHIASANPALHLCCDLSPSRPEIQRADILRMDFESNSFDAVIANHVLEHVEDDLQALAEIFRVLKPGAFAILQTPYSSKLQHTWQDAGIADDAARLQAYGQKDHVRLYGSDIFDRIASSGLIKDVRTHAQLLAGLDAAAEGVNPREPLFLFWKP